MAEKLCSDKTDSITPSLKKNAALNMTKSVMSLIFPLITFPYSSRVLGPVYIGKVNFAQSVVSYFSLIAALGISTYAVREAAKVREDKNQLSVFIKEIFTLNLISTFVAYILFALALFFVPQLGGYKKLLVICGASVLFTTLGMDYLYTALEEFKYITLRSIFFQFLSLILLFVFVKDQNDYYKYAAISVVSSVGSNFLNFLHARKFISLNTKVRLCLKKHLKPVFTLFAMSAAISIYTVLDTTMLGLIKGDESVGLYTAATKINRMILMMITAATTVLLPRLSYYAGKERKLEFLRLAQNAMNFVVMLSVPCAMGLFILAEPVILLFSGNQYVSSITAMQIMNAIIILIGMSNVIGIQIFMSVGKEKITLYSVIAGAVVNFCINLILIPHFGVNGAAIGTVCAEFCVTLVQFMAARAYFERRNFVLHFIKVVVATFVMSFCVFILCRILDSLPLKIILGIVSGAVIYALCLFFLRDSLFMEILGQIIGKVYLKVCKGGTLKR